MYTSYTFKSIHIYVKHFKVLRTEVSLLDRPSLTLSSLYLSNIYHTILCIKLKFIMQTQGKRVNLQNKGCYFPHQLLKRHLLIFILRFNFI